MRVIPDSWKLFRNKKHVLKKSALKTQEQRTDKTAIFKHRYKVQKKAQQSDFQEQKNTIFRVTKRFFFYWFERVILVYDWSFPCDFSIFMRPIQFNFFLNFRCLEIKLSNFVKFRFVNNLKSLLKYSDVPRPCSWLFLSKIQEQKYKQEQRNKNKYKVISYHRMAVSCFILGCFIR